MLGTRPILKCKSIKVEHSIHRQSNALLHSEGHNSFTQSVIEANEYTMESLFDKISNRLGFT